MSFNLPGGSSTDWKDRRGSISAQREPDEAHWSVQEGFWYHYCLSGPGTEIFISLLLPCVPVLYVMFDVTLLNVNSSFSPVPWSLERNILHWTADHWVPLSWAWIPARGWILLPPFHLPRTCCSNNLQPCFLRYTIQSTPPVLSAESSCKYLQLMYLVHTLFMQNYLQRTSGRSF